MKTVNIENKTYITVTEAAEKYGVTPKTIYEWIRAGKIEKKKVGSATFVRG